MWFWIAASGMMAGVAASLMLALLRKRSNDAGAAAFDLQVYRDQLREVERDLARGVIGEEDAERTRTEISRRIIETDRALNSGQETGAAPKTATRLMAVAVAALLIGGAVWGYGKLGVEGYSDLPLKARIATAEELRENRMSQATAEAQTSLPALEQQPDERFLELMARLRAAVAERPDDVQGQILLARNEGALGNYAVAHAAQAKVIALKGGAATADDYAALADLMILATGGYVSPEAEQALNEVLQRDPRNGTARFYSGLMFAQTGRPDMAFRIWRPLLEESAPNAPWVLPIRAQIAELADLAGVKYTAPAAPGVGGPSAEDMNAAAEMTDADRQEMIRGMVTQLNERLASEGGTAEEWARLIGAYGVLGEADRARAIWTEAQGIFAERAEDLAAVRAAAESAGVAD